MGKQMPELSRLEFLEKFLVKYFALSDAEDDTSRPLHKGGIVDLSLLRTLLASFQKFLEPSLWEWMNSFVLLAYASLASSRLYFRFRRFILLVKTKKVISMHYGRSTSN